MRDEREELRLLLRQLEDDRPVRSRRARHAVLLGLALLLGCTREDASDDEATASAGTPPYDVPLRDDAELATAAARVCREAQVAGRPVLVEFSAAWCSDCRALAGMKTAPALAAELERWSRLTINVGRFDRHRPLLAALEVEAIAHWSIFAPTDCDQPLEAWPRRARRTLEVSSGDARHLTPGDLAAWLEAQRTPAGRDRSPSA